MKRAEINRNMMDVLSTLSEIGKGLNSYGEDGQVTLHRLLRKGADGSENGIKKLIDFSFLHMYGDIPVTVEEAQNLMGGRFLCAKELAKGYIPFGKEFLNKKLPSLNGAKVHEVSCLMYFSRQIWNMANQLFSRPGCEVENDFTRELPGLFAAVKQTYSYENGIIGSNFEGDAVNHTSHPMSFPKDGWYLLPLHPIPLGTYDSELHNPACLVLELTKFILLNMTVAFREQTELGRYYTSDPGSWSKNFYNMSFKYEDGIIKCRYNFESKDNMVSPSYSYKPIMTF